LPFRRYTQAAQLDLDRSRLRDAVTDFALPLRGAWQPATIVLRKHGLQRLCQRRSSTEFPLILNT